MTIETKPNLFDELRRAHVFRYSGLYFAFAWGSITVVDVIGDNIGAPAWIEPILVALWVTIFPVFLLFIWVNRRKHISAEHTISRGGFDIIIAIIVSAIVIYSGIRLVALFSDGSNRTTKQYEFSENLIRIGGKDFLEQSLLVELLAHKIENDFPDITVNREHYIGETDYVLSRVIRGEVDLWVDYSGTILSVHLNKQTEVTQRVGNHTTNALNRLILEDGIYPSQVLSPLGFENNYTLVMRRSDAVRLLGPEPADWTISNLAQISRNQEFSFGVNYGFAARADGMRGLSDYYDLEYKVQQFDHDDVYRMLETSAVDFVIGFTTDAQLGYNERFLELRDDKGFWPIYRAYPLINSQYAKENPEVVESINSLRNEFSAIQIRTALRRIQDAGFTMENVRARDFNIIREEARRMLSERGLINRS